MFVAVGALLFYNSIVAIKNGYYDVPSYPPALGIAERMKRDGNPLRFWFMVIGGGMVSVFFIWFGITLSQI